MCGIVGFSGDFSKNLLAKMAAQIAHRGSDGYGALYFNAQHNQAALGFAHHRLSIIDLSAEGSQPMTVVCACCQPSSAKNEDKLWLIYNGELYNYMELRAQLIAKGHRFHSQTDSEVLLHLYTDLGTAMLQKLQGIFAFAIYDGRLIGQNQGMEKGDIFLARDAIGVKPLYYSECASGFIFGSELKSLLASTAISRAVDPKALHYYLSYLWCPGKQTAFTAIKKCQPGEALLIRQGKIKSSWFFYDIPYHGNYRTDSEAELTVELKDYLQNAVKRQLMSDVPLGAFLSGGLDSSAIVALVKKLAPQQNLETYCIVLRDGYASEGNVNDLPYAQAVANHLRVKLNTIEVDANILQHLETMLYHLDGPEADPAAIHVLLIAKAAREAGIKVLLSGTGGDDIFSGYRRHQALHFQQKKYLPIWMKRGLGVIGAQMCSGAYLPFMMKNASIRRAAKFLSQWDQVQNGDKQLANYFFWGTEALRRNLYSDEMRLITDPLDSAEPLLNSLQRIPHETEPLNRMLYLETKHFLADHNLNYTDKMAMAAGVEVRVPLLDLDLVQFAANLPSQLKQKGSTSKYIFKKAMESDLPHAVIHRPKTGFGVPLRRWVSKELTPIINATLSEENLKKRGYFNPSKVHHLMKQNRLGQVDASYTIFSLLCIELWCQQFVDKSW